VLAQWAMAGEAPLDLWSVDIRRFSGLHRDRAWTCARTLEAYGKHYTIAIPHEEYESGRPRIVSPLYERLKARGACFGSKLGWERANWFAPPGMEPKDVYSMGRQNWFAAVGEEHRAVRERAGLFDQSSFAKFEIRGRDAETALSWICANDVAKPPGRVTYTQMLNSRGGIECDLTVARLAADQFYVVTGTGFRTHDFAWISEHIGHELEASIEDVTEAWSTLSLMGPKSRQIMAAVTRTDLSNAAFPFGHVREVEIAGHRLRALRVTYVGELGWELHMPAEAAGDVFDALIDAGTSHGMALCGYRAIESLRLEKGYRAWGADITPNDSPFHAGLGWAVKLRSNAPFLGREASARIAADPLAKMLAGFATDDPGVVLVGRETILRNGEFAGYLTSGGYGYTIGKPIGYGYVRNAAGVTRDYVLAGDYELVVAEERVKARVHLEPLYDPTNARVKS
jgi:4-methylaminobutanoate oxidase (formaldehyde-forming)